MGCTLSVVPSVQAETQCRKVWGVAGVLTGVRLFLTAIAEDCQVPCLF